MSNKLDQEIVGGVILAPKVHEALGATAFDKKLPDPDYPVPAVIEAGETIFQDRQSIPITTPFDSALGPITAHLYKAQMNGAGGVAAGRIYADTRNRWGDGTYIHTSTIQVVVAQMGKNPRVGIITRNSVYELHAEPYAFGEGE